jgi:hypothetical protein
MVYSVVTRTHSNLAEVVILLTSILDMSGSVLTWDPDVKSFAWFSHLPPEECQDSI